jgi:hypothetical protein
MSLAETNLEASQLTFVVFFPCTIWSPDNNGLSGPLPTEIGLLASLEELDFSELLDIKVVSTPCLFVAS